MTSILAFVILQNAELPKVERDNYGVSQITASNISDASFEMGKILAQDRLWQMEMSRRSARGQLAEILGPSAVKSDEETLKRAYTDSEYAAMFAQLPPSLQDSFKKYADGVNAEINSRIQNNSLPPGYTENNFLPQPWTTTDSCAIAVMMARRFGGGGAGELRNFAVAQYLQIRPLKDKLFDVVDDLVWFNDIDSPTTISRGDDPVANRPNFHLPTREQSAQHLARLPKTSLFELASAVSAADYSENKLVAESLAVPYKTGSYAIVVAPKRSATGNPLILTAPQMGHTSPGVVHEISFNVPNYQVSGMNVPGVPGVIIGNSPSAAWGLTTGVADLEDVFVSNLVDSETYQSSGKNQKLEKLEFIIKIKGEPSKTVTQLRTIHGPVLLLSKASKAVFSLKSSYFKRELASYSALSSLPNIKSVNDVNEFSRRIPVGFNFFFALKSGDIGHRFLGFVPIRAKGVDPRLPTLDEAEFQWQGIIPTTQMPRVDAPSEGLITNWNNKPVWWWPNGDTPAWGALFRNKTLNESLTAQKLTTADLEKAAWDIARKETETNLAFQPLFNQALMAKYGINRPEEAKQLMAFNGWQLEGSIPATLYNATLRELRREIFLADLGNLTQDALFEQAVQPTVILRALQAKTKYNWLKDRKPNDVIITAFDKATARLRNQYGEDLAAWGYKPGTMPDPSGSRIPYNNRGTYIQISELTPSGIFARSIASPGVAESGPNSANQTNLARVWQYKPVWTWPKNK